MNSSLKDKIESFRTDLFEFGIDLADESIAFLDQKYSEPRRHYHNWDHIEHCLKMYDEVSYLLNDPLAVKTALIYHDVIYDIGSADNEDKSAELAFETFSEHPEFASRVRDLIADTHYGREARLSDDDAKLMKDIDFSSFARPFEDFWNDILSLNEEEGNRDPQNRISFYKKILSGEFIIFRTDYFKETYFEVVMENLKKGIERLSDL